VVPGRPRRLDEPTETVAVRLPKSLISRVDALANHAGRSRANYLALLIRRVVEGDPTVDTGTFSQPQRAIVEAMISYASDPTLRTWVDHKTDTLYFDVTFSGTRRRIAFYDVATHDLGSLNAAQQADVLKNLFARFATWPDGLAEVRCIADEAVMNSNPYSRTVLGLFVGNVPASDAVVVTTPMRAS
jgi:hypothetical protein